MTSNDPLISELAKTNPVPCTARPAGHERAEADRVLLRVLAVPPRSRSRWPIVAPVSSALVVLMVVAVALTLGGSDHGGTSGSRGLQITLQAQPTTQTPAIARAAMSREVELLHQRLGTVLHSFSVKQAGASRVVVATGSVGAGTRARIAGLLTAPGVLYFYDWEANVLTPNGKTVASQLGAQDPAALTISQGSSLAAPGQPDAGAVPLYKAVRLAATQPQAPSTRNARPGPQYYLFGEPGSSACEAKAKTEGTIATVGQHCLLAGPDSELSSTSRREAVKDLAAQLPAGTASEGEVLVVPQGTIVLQAANPGAGHQIKFTSPSARFYVLHDLAALRGQDITNPRQSTDASGAPDITFGFTPAGAKEFQSATAEIARRGQVESTLAQTLNQHFAVTDDHQLLTVPSIDYKVYPDGISGENGAHVSGSFTKQSAKDLAAELRYGPLPLQLRLVR